MDRAHFAVCMDRTKLISHARFVWATCGPICINKAHHHHQGREAPGSRSALSIDLHNILPAPSLVEEIDSVNLALLMAIIG